jgi:hypothetical protein
MRIWEILLERVQPGIKVKFTKQAMLDMFGINRGRLKVFDKEGQVYLKVITDFDAAGILVNSSGVIKLPVEKFPNIRLNYSYKMVPMGSHLWAIMAAKNPSVALSNSMCGFMTSPIDYDSVDRLERRTSEQNTVITGMTLGLNVDFSKIVREKGLTKLGFGNIGKNILIDPTCSVTDVEGILIKKEDRSGYKIWMSLEDAAEMGIDDGSRWVVRSSIDVPGCWEMVIDSIVLHRGEYHRLFKPGVTASFWREYK